MNVTIRIKQLKDHVTVKITPDTKVDLPLQKFPTMDKATGYVTGFLRNSASKKI